MSFSIASLAELPSYLLAAWLIERIGRCGARKVAWSPESAAADSNRSHCAARGIPVAAAGLSQTASAGLPCTPLRACAVSGIWLAAAGTIPWLLGCCWEVWPA
jgi:hypothetical protein